MSKMIKYKVNMINYRLCTTAVLSYLHIFSDRTKMPKIYSKYIEKG